MVSGPKTPNFDFFEGLKSSFRIGCSGQKVGVAKKEHYQRTWRLHFGVYSSPARLCFLSVTFFNPQFSKIDFFFFWVDDINQRHPGARSLITFRQRLATASVNDRVNPVPPIGPGGANCWTTFRFSNSPGYDFRGASIMTFGQPKFRNRNSNFDWTKIVATDCLCFPLFLTIFGPRKDEATFWT